MKYIINENKMNEVIYSYIDNLFHNNELGNLHSNYYTDEDGNESDIAFEFYFGDYGDGETAFRWYSQEYFIYDCDKCPIIEIAYGFEEELNSLFSDKWKEPFKKWFKKNYSLDVKTIQ